MKKIGFGAVCIGQAGINIGNQFAKKGIPTIAIDTTKQNLDSCNHIKGDLKFHAKINAWGGAGKRAELGEEAIIKHAESLYKVFENNLSDCDYIWVCNSLGGGTGTLGGVQVSNILDSLGMVHGMVVTLPDESQEGLDEINNAYIGLGAIEKAREHFDNLRSIIIIENKKLKEEVMNEYDVSFENMWDKANEHIFNQFYNLFDYSQKSSNHTLDGQDYMRILEKQGYMIFGEKVVDDIENTSENVLINEIEETWENNVFVEDLGLHWAKGLAVVIDRPESYAQDGRVINKFLSRLKDFVGMGTFCSGVYETKKGIKGKLLNDSKPLKMITAISGMPFPKKRFEELEEMAINGSEEYQEKDKRENIEIKLNRLASIINENKGVREKKERKRRTFSIFNKDSGNSEVKNGKKRLDRIEKFKKFKDDNK